MNGRVSSAGTAGEWLRGAGESQRQSGPQHVYEQRDLHEPNVNWQGTSTSDNEPTRELPRLEQPVSLKTSINGGQSQPISPGGNVDDPGSLFMLVLRKQTK
jgi:hypothetical protein